MKNFYLILGIILLQSSPDLESCQEGCAEVQDEFCKSAKESGVADALRLDDCVANFNEIFEGLSHEEKIKKVEENGPCMDEYSDYKESLGAVEDFCK